MSKKVITLMVVGLVLLACGNLMIAIGNIIKAGASLK